MLSDIFRSALTILSPKLNTEVVFFFKFHRRINWKNPQTLNEKILKLKLDSYGSDPKIRQCADKYAVRSYVEAKGLRDMLIPLLAAYDRAEDIVWDTLPEAFALKWNFGCGFNLICTDKKKLKQEDTILGILKCSIKACQRNCLRKNTLAQPMALCRRIISFIASTASRWRSCI